MENVELRINPPKINLNEAIEGFKLLGKFALAAILLYSITRYGFKKMTSEGKK